MRKEEFYDEDEDEKSIASAFANGKKKSPINKGNLSPRTQSNANKGEKKLRKEESDEEFEKPSSKKARAKTDNKVQKKTKKEAEAEKKGKGGKVVDVKKREKKVYDLPGQKRDPPEERDPLRIFYESLHEQVPGSEMAAIWMMESGLLPKEEAKKVFDRKQKRAQQNKLGSPMKTVVTVKKKEESVTIVKKSSTTPISTQKKKTPDSKTPISTLKKKTPDSKTSTSPISTLKKKTPDLKSGIKQSEKRKSKEDSSEEEEDSSEEDSDDDFVTDANKSNKKQRAS